MLRKHKVTVLLCKFLRPNNAGKVGDMVTVI